MGATVSSGVALRVPGFLGEVKNADYARGLLEGLTWVLRYYRFRVKNGKSPPKVLKVSRIIRELGLDDTHKNRTRIGWALGYLTKKGYLYRWSNNRHSNYLARDKLFKHFEAYPCLSHCESDSSICGLCGSSQCPFLQGFLGCE